MADTTEQDVMTLWNFMAPLIEKQLKASGSFTTFAAKLKPNNTIEAAVAAATTNPTETLLAHLRSEAASGMYRAIGVASDVQAEVPETTAPVSGIYFTFDNAEGVSQATFQPYTTDANRNIILGKIHAQEGDHAIFPKGSSPT